MSSITSKIKRCVENCSKRIRSPEYFGCLDDAQQGNISQLFAEYGSNRCHSPSDHSAASASHSEIHWCRTEVTRVGRKMVRAGEKRNRSVQILYIFEKLNYANRTNGKSFPFGPNPFGFRLQNFEPADQERNQS